MHDSTIKTMRGWSLWLGALLLALSALFAPAAVAGDVTLVSTAEAHRKLSDDLAAAIGAPSLPAANWAHESVLGRKVKVVVLALAGLDPDMR